MAGAIIWAGAALILLGLLGLIFRRKISEGFDNEDPVETACKCALADGTPIGDKIDSMQTEIDSVQKQVQEAIDETKANVAAASDGLAKLAA